MLLPVLAGLLLLLSARSLLFDARPSELAGHSMGTTWSVRLGGPGPELANARQEALRERVQAALDAVEAAMSTFRPDSELSRFNRHASEAAFPLSEATLAVLELAQQVSARSGGAFDVTLRPLVAAWGFGAGARLPGDEPRPDEIAALRARVGFELLRLDPAAGTARKLHPELEIDLSAIAKGYGVDRAVLALREAGVADALVEVGGELRASGERPGGGPWRVAIERPDPEGRAVHGILGLSDRALATSGDYRSFYEAGGVRRSHLIDPRSGRPVAHGLASVSVVAETAALADAWATALIVLGPEPARRLAEREGLAAYGIVREPDGRIWSFATRGFPELELAGPPSADPTRSG